MQPPLQCSAYCKGEINPDAVGLVGVPVAEGALDAAKRALAKAAPVGDGAGRRRLGRPSTRCAQP